MQNDVIVAMAKDIIRSERMRNAVTLKRLMTAVTLLRFLTFFQLGMLFYKFSYVILIVNIALCFLGISLSIILRSVYKTYYYYLNLCNDLNV